MEIKGPLQLVREKTRRQRGTDREADGAGNAVPDRATAGGMTITVSANIVEKMQIGLLETAMLKIWLPPCFSANVMASIDFLQKSVP
jgi:hypothetical protein